LRSLKRGTTTTTANTTTSSNNNNKMVIANENNNSNSGSGDGVMKIPTKFKESDRHINSTHKLRSDIDVVNDNNNYDVKYDDITRIDKSFHDDEISKVTLLYMNKLNIIENELKIADDEIIKYKNEIQIYKSIINNSTSTNSNNYNNSNSNNNNDLHNIITENKLKFENEKKSLQDIYENRLEDMRRSHTNYIEQMTSLWKQEREKLLEQIQKEENRCQDLRLELMKVINSAASTTSNNSRDKQKIMPIELNHFQVCFYAVITINCCSTVFMMIMILIIIISSSSSPLSPSSSPLSPSSSPLSPSSSSSSSLTTSSSQSSLSSSSSSLS
jgi:hypothetical protein